MALSGFSRTAGPHLSAATSTLCAIFSQETCAGQYAARDRCFGALLRPRRPRRAPRPRQGGGDPGHGHVAPGGDVVVRTRERRRSRGAGANLQPRGSAHRFRPSRRSRGARHLHGRSRDQQCRGVRRWIRRVRHRPNLSGCDSQAAAVLGRARLRPLASSQHRGGRGNDEPRHLPPLARSRALERVLPRALNQAGRQPLRRQPQQGAAPHAVPGYPQAGPRERAGAVPRLPRGARHRHQGARPTVRRG